MATLFKTKRTIREAINSYTDGNDDPLTRALLPDPGESEEERIHRIEKFNEAQKVSREIDAEILESKKTFEKKNKAIKILLLGQAESGKSSVLKNFQLALAPNHFRSEAMAWKTIINLNLISSIKVILDVMQEEWLAATDSSHPTPLTDKHRRISIGLSPLLSIANGLNKKLDGQTPDLSREVCVRPGSGWKAKLGISMPTSPKKAQGQDSKKIDEVSSILSVCRDDIIELWEDPAVQEVLKARDVRLEESPGFFLNDITRIAAMGYEPTDTDIVRARIRTMGVDEHRFKIESGVRPGSEWCIFDVGGSRSMRANWIPYFDNVEAIIFLAPLSFHLVLDEDPKVNRVEDSIGLWREICSNKLLVNASLILFLNKMDILRRNLASGMQVRKYVPSYGDLPNDYAHVTKYFKEKFRAYHVRARHLSPNPRAFICHELSAIDTDATAPLLTGVREGILFRQLSQTQMI